MTRFGVVLSILAASATVMWYIATLVFGLFVILFFGQGIWEQTQSWKKNYDQKKARQRHFA